MPGLHAPSDYYNEPSRNPSLKINSKEPFNAEPHRFSLISSYVTPVDLFYKRNHGPIPIVDDIERYRLSVTGLIEIQKELSMRDIRDLPKYTIAATLQCAGNRRTAMSETRKVKGVGWDIAALGNAVWGGAKLADVLELVGVPKLSSTTPRGGKHVEFVSVDRCKEENGGPYKASIPLSQATNPEADVLVAYEMNGEALVTCLDLVALEAASFRVKDGKEGKGYMPTLYFHEDLRNYPLGHLFVNHASLLLPLNRDHGYPLRVVVPGVIGARSVKWLDSISVITEESQSFFMQKDYKMFPPSVSWENINWSTRRPQMDFPVQSAICSLEESNVLKDGKVTVKGYAVSGGGRGIERVDISIDGGKMWVEASRYQKPGVPYVADGIYSDKWAWVLFEAKVEVQHSTEIVAKAVDIAGNVQPEHVETIWNLRGILNTSWHRVHVRVGHSSM